MCRKTWGRSRSQPASPRLRLGRLDRAGGERVEHVLDDVLRRQALDQLGLLEAHRGLVGDRAEQLLVLVGELPIVGEAAEDPELLVAGDQRRDQQRVLVDVRPELAGRPAPAAAATAVGPPHQVEHQAGAARARARRRGAARGRRRPACQLVRVDVEPVDLAGVGAEQLAGARW